VTTVTSFFSENLAQSSSFPVFNSRSFLTAYMRYAFNYLYELGLAAGCSVFGTKGFIRQSFMWGQGRKAKKLKYW
jgi:hypothetical protein